MNHFLGNEKEMPPTACPNCGYICDMASAVDEHDARPREGDISICIKCGHLSVFDEYFDLREPTEEEIKKFAGDKRIVAAMTALHQMHKPKEEP